MAVSAEDTWAELVALKVAVRQLIEIANLGAVLRPGSFAEQALRRGLEELADPSFWRIPEGSNAGLRIDAKRRYADLFSDLPPSP